MIRRLGLLFFVCASAQAAPQLSSTDELGQLLAERGLLTQLGGSLEQVTHTVSDKTGELVVNAMGFLGVPYHRGGNTAQTGFDCSGFVRAMYEQTVGLVLPRRSEQQAAATRTIERRELEPGDLVFFNTMRHAFSHVGIYVGDGKFIHSPKPGARVRIEDMRVSYWDRRFNGARRVTTPGADAVSAADAAPAAH
jgi:cell wall-associated NlpC family hydrolase